jgi:hypothetical protein
MSLVPLARVSLIAESLQAQRLRYLNVTLQEELIAAGFRATAAAVMYLAACREYPNWMLAPLPLPTLPFLPTPPLKGATPMAKNTEQKAAGEMKTISKVADKTAKPASSAEVKSVKSDWAKCPKSDCK